MATNYTSFYQLATDVSLYIVVRKGTSANIGLFPTIARQRWPWFVENYREFKSLFVDISNGNSGRLSSLNDLNRFVEGYKLGNTKINPFEKESNLTKFSFFLNKIEFSSIGPSPDEVALRNNELIRASKFEEVDFRAMLALLRQRTAIQAQEIGLGDETSNEILGLRPRRKKSNPRIQDIRNISNLNNIYKIIEGFIYEKQLTQKKPPNLLKSAKENSSGSGSSGIRDIYKTYIPKPFEVSLESMAKKYLGSVRNWFELAAVNNLKPPFVDETGSKFPLIAPAAVNNLIISSSLRENVAPGIRVSVGSHKHREESRIIERVVVNEDDTMVLFLSGAADLNKYLPKHEAFVRIYKPGTVRSNSIILIPSAEESSTGVAKPTPKKDEIKRLNAAFVNFGIDIAKDINDDWVIDSNGNFKLSYGVRAVRQAVRNTLRTEVNELPYHPRYGVNYSLGRTFSGTIDEAVLMSDLIRDSILSDPRIEDITLGKISATQNSASIQMSVKIKGFDTPIPLAFVS